MSEDSIHAWEHSEPDYRKRRNCLVEEPFGDEGYIMKNFECDRCKIKCDYEEIEMFGQADCYLCKPCANLFRTECIPNFIQSEPPEGKVVAEKKCEKGIMCGGPYEKCNMCGGVQDE